MNRRQFLITSLISAAAAVAAPVLKYLPQSAGGMLRPYDLAEWYRRLFERQLYSVSPAFLNGRLMYVSISEFINAD